MKKSILIVFSFCVISASTGTDAGLLFAQNDSTLYLLFEEDGKRMIQDEIFGDTLKNKKPERIYYFFFLKTKYGGDLEFEYKSSTARDTISTETLSDIQLRDYNWFKKYYTDYHDRMAKQIREEGSFRFFAFHFRDRFSQVYIVQIDSMKNRAIILPVTYRDVSH